MFKSCAKLANERVDYGIRHRRVLSALRLDALANNIGPKQHPLSERIGELLICHSNPELLDVGDEGVIAKSLRVKQYKLARKIRYAFAFSK